jgi:8-oxo-dGTP pyrophosphatase MutT (NUDIX family)
MNKEAHYQDTEYPFTGTKEKRLISRAFIVDEDGCYAVHHLVRKDIFGCFDYYETPGGGVDEGENLTETCVRECLEETGYPVQVIKEVGFVDDFYNLIERENLQHYFLCQRIGPYQGKRFVSEGDSFIKETLWLPLKEIIRLYESVPDVALPHLVRQRELPLWKELAEGKE